MPFKHSQHELYFMFTEKINLNQCENKIEWLGCQGHRDCAIIHVLCYLLIDIVPDWIILGIFIFTDGPNLV